MLIGLFSNIILSRVQYTTRLLSQQNAEEKVKSRNTWCRYHGVSSDAVSSGRVEIV